MNEFKSFKKVSVSFHVIHRFFNSTFRRFSKNQTTSVKETTFPFTIQSYVLAEKSAVEGLRCAIKSNTKKDVNSPIQS